MLLGILVVLVIGCLLCGSKQVFTFLSVASLVVVLAGMAFWVLAIVFGDVFLNLFN